MMAALQPEALLSARGHAALLALAVCVLVGGSIWAFFLWRPSSPHSIHINIQSTAAASGAGPFTATLACGKGKSLLASAAQRVPLATVMHWYGQPRFMDLDAPGTMAIPSQCLKEARADPRLAKWLDQWRGNLTPRSPHAAQLASALGAMGSAGRENSAGSQDDASDSGPQPDPALTQNSTNPQQLVELEQVLKETKLTAMPLLDIGRAVYFLSDDQTLTSRFYGAAGVRGAKQALGNLSALEYHKLLLGLNSTRPLMWRVIGSADIQPAQSLQAICDTVAKWAPTGTDRILDSDCIYAAIDSAECLYEQRKYDKAAGVLEGIYRRRLTENQQVSANWAMSLILFDSDKYDLAIPYLQSVAGSGNPHKKQALLLLFTDANRTGHHDLATETYDKIRKSYHLSSYAIDQLSADMTSPMENAEFHMGRLQR